MRIALARQGFALETHREWMVQDGWDDPALQDTHGLYLRSAMRGAEIHVCSISAAACALTPEGLASLLREQNWASPPFDDATTVGEDFVVVAGTFETPWTDIVVREFFATDGRRLANAVLRGTRAQVAAARPSAERLVASLRFEI